jgi:hypothetical protein
MSQLIPGIAQVKIAYLIMCNLFNSIYYSLMAQLNTPISIEIKENCKNGHLGAVGARWGF